MKLNKINKFLVLLLVSIIFIPLASALTITTNHDTITVNEEDNVTIELTAKNITGTTNFTKNKAEGTITKINNSKAEFEWTPQFGDAGTDKKEYEFTFKVEDDTSQDETVVKITVNKTNKPFNVTSKSGGGITHQESNTIEVEVDRQDVTCKYDLEEKSYENMAYTMSKESNYDHKGTISFSSSKQYSIYIMCEDDLKNHLENYETINFDVKLRPKAEIRLTPPSPVRQGLVNIRLTTTEPLIEAPTLTYALSGSESKESITLVGSQTSWEGYMVIEDSDIEKVGTFDFKGKSVNNIEGTEIIRGKIFIVDSEAPGQVSSLQASSQSDRIRLVWHYPTELSSQIKEYRIYRRVGSGGVDYVDYYATTTNKQFYDEDVEYNEAYYYKVSAVKESGIEGELSREFAITHRPEREQEEESLSSVLRVELEDKEKELESYLLDLDSIKNRLERESGQKREIINLLDLIDEVENNIDELENLRTELMDLEGESLSSNQFDSKTNDILNKASEVFMSTPADIEILDSTSYQEQTDDDKTLEMINQYLLAQQVNTSEQEFIDFIEETRTLQDRIIVNVENTLVKVSYVESEKNIAVITKNIDSQETLENATIIEEIPSTLTTNLRNINADIPATVMQTRSFLTWKATDLNSFSVTYFVETSSSFDDLKNTKTVVAKDKVDQIKQNLITGMVTGTPSESHRLLMPTIIILVILSILTSYYVYMNNEVLVRKANNPFRGIRHKLKERKMNILPKKKDDSHRIIDPDLVENTKVNNEPQEEIREEQTNNVNEETEMINNQETVNKIEDNETSLDETYIEEEQKTELHELRNKLHNYKESIDNNQNIPPSSIGELYNTVSEIKKLCDEIHNEKIYNYAQKTKKELEDTISKIEQQRSFNSDKIIIDTTQTEEIKAPEGQEFITSSGNKLFSVEDLKSYLNNASDEEFSHHVNSERNDFANWIEHVFHDKELASKLKEVKNKESLMALLP